MDNSKKTIDTLYNEYIDNINLSLLNDKIDCNNIIENITNITNLIHIDELQNNFFVLIYNIMMKYYTYTNQIDYFVKILLDILLKEHPSHNPTILLYKIFYLHSCNYTELINMIKNMYISNRNIYVNYFFDIIFNIYKDDIMNNKIYNFIFSNLCENDIYVLYHNVDNNIVNTNFINYINILYKNKKYSFYSNKVLFEYCLLLSCIDFDKFILLVKDILNNNYNKDDSIIKSLEYAYKNFTTESKITCLNNKKLSKKLNIALCVSGQLRGYQTAFSTWEQLGIYQHNVTIFLKTWKNIGNKFPVTHHASRIFSGNFLETYKRIFSNTSNLQKYIEKQYPQFYNLINNNTNDIIANQLEEFYNTKYINIDDDTLSPYSSMSNSEKMYYNIYVCNNMLEYNQYDIVIRIRPDLLVKNIKTSIDFYKLYDEFNKNDKLIYITNKFGRSYNNLNMLGYSFDDSFAIGSQNSMNLYANVYNNTKKLSFLYKLPHTYFGQRSLAYSTFYDGLTIKSLYDMYTLNFSLTNASIININDIYLALQEDIKSHDVVSYEDNELLLACCKDLYQTIS